MMYMKRIAALILVVLSLALLAGCGNKNIYSERTLESGVVEIDLEQIKQISQFSSLKCVYHNALTKEETKKTFLWIESDFQYWIEYDGQYEIGFDVDEISIEVEKKQITAEELDRDIPVTVTLPHAGLLSISVDKDSFDQYPIICAKESIEQKKSSLTRENFSGILDEAQTTLKEKIETNRTNYDIAEQTAKEMISNYINQLGEELGVHFRIEWKWIAETSDTK